MKKIGALLINLPIWISFFAKLSERADSHVASDAAYLRVWMCHFNFFRLKHLHLLNVRLHGVKLVKDEYNLYENIRKKNKVSHYILHSWLLIRWSSSVWLIHILIVFYGIFSIILRPVRLLKCAVDSMLLWCYLYINTIFFHFRRKPLAK